MNQLSHSFSLSRWFGILLKEFIQLKRDRLTFGMIVGIPIIQLLLFGFAINSDPKHLPTAIVMADPGPFARSYVAAMQNSDYFKIVGSVDEKEANALLDRSQVQFVVTFPPGFHRDLVRGKAPTLLVEADATDPMAAGGAISVLNKLGLEVFAPDLPGLEKTATPPLDLRVHRRYNPEGLTSYNVVPGLLGVILTMTMVLMTGLAMTRERERGTFENLLATPATPVEVMTGKIVPYILIGLIQVTLILLAARFIFDVPMHGNLLLLYAVVLLFICANLTLGITFSSIARNQLQAMQMTFFFFLPSMLLSGFMFPFRGMPEWAQVVGNVLPLTHFLVLVRGILLKGNGIDMVWSSVWPILAFIAVVLGIGLRTFRRTLD
ncbi:MULTISPECIES: ABC transporter permease [Azospira]|uniref:ABC-type multidrug transport system, permease component n=1 Tax=Azospira oryzae (strain ATCC BAA-33 / DSM 13638 / PS) TaxID=640081 RepID=G8QL43_AZOOP|nr:MULTISPECIES: ABC transporter permease [Azospira]AEV26700.1 ABC-type multidrug transport system, permease component [Azospira oryzae PS]MDK9692220.1 ABC transporter permease [Azospira sp.]